MDNVHTYDLVYCLEETQKEFDFMKKRTAKFTKLSVEDVPKNKGIRTIYSIAAFYYQFRQYLLRKEIEEYENSLNIF